MRREVFKINDSLKLVGDRGGPADAPCVILMHGGGQTRFSWVAAGERLVADGYQIINFDARGHGESDWAGNGGYSLAKHADDLIAIAATTDAPIALVGASLGGATALRAIAAGMRPEALVLVDIVPEPHPKGVARIREFMLARPEGYETLDEVADAIASYNPNRQRPSDSKNLIRNMRQSEDGRYRWHWDPAFLGREVTVELKDMAETMEGARAAGNIPVLLIRGMESDVVDERSTEQLRDILPALEVADIPGAGHMVAGDNNDLFNAALLEFLRHRFPANRYAK